MRNHYWMLHGKQRGLVIEDYFVYQVHAYKSGRSFTVSSKLVLSLAIYTAKHSD